MDTTFFRKIFGEKLVNDFQIELDKIRKSWIEHIEKDEKEHQEILKFLSEIKERLEIKENDK